MAKSMQILSEETRRLAFIERGIYIFKALQLYKSVVATSNPTKMGLALHCHGELKVANGRNGRERDTKRKKESFPQALAHLQALQK